ncbi:GLPGLI family protein [Subsaximicrobium wynnwilliamsii]|nr:GLPGLI family protein [Subsaximicrobium wynnwilliamsii]
MYKYILLFSVILSFQEGFSQKNKTILVEYQATKNNFKNTETLIAEKDKAIYIIDSLLIENEKNTNIATFDEYSNKITVSQKTIKLDATRFYMNQNSDIIYFTQKFNEEITIIKDSLSSFNWELQNETKKIDDFTCKKARANFRGSEIIAWYTEDIGLPFGPWKFKGLPGLILEVYNVNDTNIFHWSVTKIKFPYTKAVNFNYPEDMKMINYQTVVDDAEEQIKEHLKRSQARVPQGVTLSETTITRSGIEKIYEWEK